jgi:transcriptional regulator with XRE-family HTH domain
MATRNWQDVRRELAADDPTFEAGVARERAKLELAMAMRELRDKAGLTQTELAEVLGVTQANVSRIENEGDPHLSTLLGYVGALGADIAIKAIVNDIEEITLIEVKGRVADAETKGRGFSGATSKGKGSGKMISGKTTVSRRSRASKK